MANQDFRVKNGLQVGSGITTPVSVGIGTTLDPSSHVDVRGTIQASGIVTASQFTGSGAGLTSLPSESLTGTISSARLSGTYNIDILGTVSGDTIDATTATVSEQLNVGAGNTGVFATAADGTLLVTGIATFKDRVIFDSTNSIQIPVGTDAEKDAVGTAVTGQIRYNTTNSQFEGFGPGNDWGSLGGVKDVDGDTYVKPESSPGSDEDALTFFTGGTERAVIDSNGNVGIATTNPTSRLDVRGTLNVSGDSTFSGDLTVGTATTGVVARTDGTLNVTGVSTLNAVRIGDGGDQSTNNLFFGADNDLKIYHTGTHAFIENSTGNVYLRSNVGSSINIEPAAGASGIIANAGGNVELYYNNSKKFETVGGGVSVSSGTASTATIYGPGNLVIDPMPVGVGTTSGIVRIKGDLYVDGTTTEINSTTLTVDDLNIVVASGATNGLTADGAGLTVDGVNASLLYDGVNDLWKLNRDVVIDSTGYLQVPVGLSTDRPTGAGVTLGQIRYNSELSQFEGYGAGDAWGSLGGVKDVDQDTYIIAESSAGADEDALTFFTGGTERAVIDSNGKVGIGSTQPTATLDINGTLNVSGVSTFQDDVTIGTEETAAFFDISRQRVGIGTTNSVRADGTFISNAGKLFFPLVTSGSILQNGAALISAGSPTSDYGLFVVDKLNDPIPQNRQKFVRQYTSGHYTVSVGSTYSFVVSNHETVSAGAPDFAGTPDYDISFIVNPDTSTELRYNYTKKLETTGYGVSVTDGLNVSGVSTFQGNVAIGTHTPLAALDVAGAIRQELHTPAMPVGLNDDIGTNWDRVSFEVPGENLDVVNALAYCGDGIVLAGTGGYYGDVFRSTDYGKTWIKSPTGVPTPGAEINSLVYCGNGIALAGSGYSNAGDGDIYRSTDYGQTWTKIYDSTTLKNILSLVYCGDGIVLAGSGSDTGDGDVYRSTDFGLNWTKVEMGSDLERIYSLCYLGNGIVLAGSGSNTGEGDVYRSTDFGQNWTKIEMGADLERILSFAYCENGIVLAGAGAGSSDGDVYRSTDFGQNWTKIEMGATYDSILSLAYCDNGIVLAGSGSQTGDADIFKSTDYGQTWTNVTDGSYQELVSEVNTAFQTIESLLYCGNGIVLAGGGNTLLKGDVFRSDVGFSQASTVQSIHHQNVTGNIGINSTSPTAKLDVNGTLNVSGVATAQLFSGNGGSLTNVDAVTAYSADLSTIATVADSVSGIITYLRTNDLSYADHTDPNNPPPSLDNLYGHDVTISGDGKVVFITSTPEGADYGSVHIYERTTSGYNYIGFVTETSHSVVGAALTVKHWGEFVATNGDGSIFAVGSPQSINGPTASNIFRSLYPLGLSSSESDSGEQTVHIFQKNGSTIESLGIVTTGLYKGASLSDGDYFGASLAFSKDGSRLYVGAPRRNNIADFATNQMGAVHVFDKSGSSYTHVGIVTATGLVSTSGGDVGAVATNETLGFGAKIACSDDGNKIFVANPYGFTRTTQNGTYFRTGWVAAYDRSGSTFTQVGIITGVNGTDSYRESRFGHGLACSSDGQYVIIGAPNYDSNGLTDPAGRLQVYKRNGNSFENYGIYISPQSLDGNIYGRIGYDIACNSDATRIITGEPAYGVSGSTEWGSIQTLARTGSTIVRTGVHTAPRASGFFDSNGDQLYNLSYFGHSVDMDDSGSNLLVGALTHTIPGELSVYGGSAYIFEESRQIALHSSQATGYIGVGTDNPTVEFEVDGDVKISGILTANNLYGEASGLTNVTAADSYKSALSDRAFKTDEISGSVTVSREELLTYDSALGAAKIHVSGNGRVIFTGAVENGTNGSLNDVIVIHERTGSTYTQVGFVTQTSHSNPGAAQTTNGFGPYVTSNYDGTIFAVGTPDGSVSGTVGSSVDPDWWQSSRGTGQQTVQIFQRQGSTITNIGILTSPSLGDSTTNGELFGHGLAMSSDGSTLYVGSPDREESSIDSQGAVFVYDKSGSTYNYVGMITSYLNYNNSGASAIFPGFGADIDCSSDGNIVAIGDPLVYLPYIPNTGGATIAGSIQVFERSGNSFNNVGVLSAYGDTPNYLGSYSPRTRGFGMIVRCTNDGQYVYTISANYSQDTNGELFLFKRDSVNNTYVGVATYIPYISDDETRHPDDNSSNKIGHSLDINGDGTRIYMGEVNFISSGAANERGGNLRTVVRVGDTLSSVGVVTSGLTLNSSQGLFSTFAACLGADDSGETIGVGAPYVKYVGYSSDLDYLHVYKQTRGTSLFSDPVTGNIGIGTSSPTVSLDVNGDLNITGIATAQKFVGDGSQLRSLPTNELVTYASHADSSYSSSQVSAISGYRQVGAAVTHGYTHNDPSFANFETKCSADGKIFAVSAHEDTETAGSGYGVVHVYERHANSNTRIGILTGSYASDAGDRFGTGIALSADGKTIVVGADADETPETGSSDGVAYVFDFIDGEYKQVGILTSPETAYTGKFGASIAMSSNGKIIYVGAYQDTFYDGAVHCFDRDGDQFNYVGFVTTAEYSNTANNFGYAVDCTPDGKRLVVGAPGQTYNPNFQFGFIGSNKGVVYVYDRIEDNFENVGILTSHYDYAYNTSYGGSFGIEVQISADGNTIAASSAQDMGDSRNYQANGGTVYIFDHKHRGTRIGLTGDAGTSEWVNTAALWAQDAGDINELYGRALALSADGNLVAVGAPGMSGDDYPSSDSGVVYVYKRDTPDTIGIQTGYGYQFTQCAKFTQADVTSFYLYGGFGHTLDMSADGKSIIVGRWSAGGNGEAAAYIFDQITKTYLSTSSRTGSVHFKEEHLSRIGDNGLNEDFGLNWNKVELDTYTGSNADNYTTIRALEYCGNGIVLAGVGSTAVGTADSGTIYRSTDYGKTWQNMNTNLITEGNSAYVKTIEYCGNGIVLAGVTTAIEGTTSGFQLLRSTDYGQNWNNLVIAGSSFTFTPDQCDAVNDLVYIGDGKIIAGVNTGGDFYESNDYGLTWDHQSIDGGGSDFDTTLTVEYCGRGHEDKDGEGIVLIAGGDRNGTDSTYQAGNAFVVTYENPHRTSGNYLAWQPRTSIDPNVTRINVLKYCENDIVLAGTASATNDYALFRSTDYGKSWNNITSYLPSWSSTEIRTIEYCGNGIIFAGSLSSPNATLYKSTDFGFTWELVSVSVTGSSIESIKYCGGDVIFSMDNGTLAGDQGCIFRSDSGFAEGQSLQGVYHQNKTGNIGIGTTNAVSTLTVDGNISALGFVGDGSSLSNVIASSSYDSVNSDYATSVGDVYGYAPTKKYTNDVGSYDRYGEFVSISGDGNILAVSEKFGDSDPRSVTDGGQVIILKRTGGSDAFSTVGVITAGQYYDTDSVSNTDTGGFATGLDLNYDGTTIIVGAPYHHNPDYTQYGSVMTDMGLAYVYDRNKITNELTLVGILTAGSPDSSLDMETSAKSGVGTDANFGYSVSVNYDGTRYAVGAPNEYHNVYYDGSGGGSAGYAEFEYGAVHVFDRSGSTFTEVKRITNQINGQAHSFDRFGHSIKMSNNGDLIYIGAPGAGGYDSNPQQHGVVCAYDISQTGIANTLGILTGGNNISEFQDNFGSSVTCSHDGSIIIVGAPDDEPEGTSGNPSSVNKGMAYVFEKDNSNNFNRIGIITNFNDVGGSSTDPDTIYESNNFGSAVACNSDASIIAISDIGAEYTQNFLLGAVGIYKRSGSTITRTDIVKVNETGSPATYNSLSINVNFGNSLSLSDSGRYLAIGAPLDNILTSGGPASGQSAAQYTSGSATICIQEFKSIITTDDLVNRVGIGSTQPTATLDINGTLNVSGITTLGVTTTTNLTAQQLNVSGVTTIFKSNGSDLLNLTRNTSGGGTDVGFRFDVYNPSANSTTLGITRILGNTSILNITDQGVVYPSASGTVDLGRTNNKWGTAYATVGNFVELSVSSDSIFSGNLTVGTATTGVVARTDGTLNVSGIATAQKFIGDGSELTNLPPAGIDLVTYASASNIANSAESISGISSYIQLDSLLSSQTAGAGRPWYFGISNAMSADASTLIVGARDGSLNGSSDNTGLVHVFDREGNSYREVGILTAGAYADDGDNFGSSVACSTDGRRIVVGAHNDEDPNNSGGSGLVHIFDRQGDTFTRVGVLTGSYAFQSIDNFGYEVDCSGDGNVIAVGAYLDETGATGSTGVVYVFDRSGNNFTEVGIITSSSNAASDFLGQSVSISEDGNTIVASATGDGSNDEGIVYVFDRTGTNTFNEVGILTGGTYANQSGEFGNRVKISSNGKTIVVGCPSAEVDEAVVGTGLVHIFDRNPDNTFTRVGVLTGSHASQTSDYFGDYIDVSADGNTIAVGAYFDELTGGNNFDIDDGLGYVFTRQGDTFEEVSTFIRGRVPTLSADGKTVAFGDPNYESGGSGAGRVLIYEQKRQTYLHSTSTGNIGIGVTNPTAKLDVDGSIAIKNHSIVSITTSHTSTAGISSTIDTFATSENDLAEYTIHVGCGNTIQAQKVLVMHDGVDAYSQEYAIMHNPSKIVSIEASISGGNVLLQATPETGISGITTYKIVRGGLA